MRKSFNPLWINTALKQQSLLVALRKVSIPYGLTLLSNGSITVTATLKVSIPYGLTLLSNAYYYASHSPLVSIPYGLTLLSN